MSEAETVHWTSIDKQSDRLTASRVVFHQMNTSSVIPHAPKRALSGTNTSSTCIFTTVLGSKNTRHKCNKNALLFLEGVVGGLSPLTKSFQRTPHRGLDPLPTDSVLICPETLCLTFPGAGRRALPKNQCFRNSGPCLSLVSWICELRWTARDGGPALRAPPPPPAVQTGGHHTTLESMHTVTGFALLFHRPPTAHDFTTAKTIPKMNHF